MTVFRLRARRAVGGDHVFDRPFGSLIDAVAFAEANIVVLAEHGAWRVRSFDVLELPSWRTVTTVHWHDPDSDPDPFGQVLPLQGDTALAADNTPVTPGPGVVPPPASRETGPG